MRGENGRWGRVVTAIATPFTIDGAVDLNRAGELAQWLVANGSDALVINGTTGESPTTTRDEKLSLVKTAIAAIGSAKVIAGVGGNDTASVVSLTKASEEAGASAILAVAPYYNKPSQEGLYRHFRAVAEATTLPVILYNVPARTITNIEASTTARLAKDAANIVATKEASANLAQIAEIARLTPETFDLYSGDDATTLPILVVGGVGVISVISHLNGLDLQKMHNAYFAGDYDTARALFYKTLPLTRAIFSAPSPSPLKYALSRIGQSIGGVRLPLIELTEAEEKVVDAALLEYGLGGSVRASNVPVGLPA